MAIPFDTDPLGSVLEYGHLHKTNDARGRQAWETANIKGTVGQSPWLGYSNWTSRNNYPACGVVPTGPHEMSLYVQRNYGQKSAYLERMTLRTDGFTSVHAPYDGGELVTKPLTFTGSRLGINYVTSAAGSVRVEIQNAAGKPIEGFTLAECPEIIGDEIERVVRWKSGSDVSRLAAKPVRLRFLLADGDLYSVRFLA